MKKRAYKCELAPSQEQVSQFIQCAGISRFSWNWGLADRNNRYRNNVGNEQFTTAINQNKEITRLKKTELTWMKKYSKTIHQNSLRQLEQAFKNFFGGTHKFPKFKKKNKTNLSFRLTSTIRISRQENTEHVSERLKATAIQRIVLNCLMRRGFNCQV